jgi:hypothetical protein
MTSMATIASVKSLTEPISTHHTQPHPDALRASTLPLQGRVFAARRAGYFLP